MPKDIQLLYENLKAKGLKINTETYSTERLKAAFDLKGDAREIMLCVTNQHPDFKDNTYIFYEGTPQFLHAKNILFSNETDGKTLWDNPDFDVLWQDFFPKNWEKDTKRAWHRLSTVEKFSLLNAFANNWAFAETTLVDWLDYTNYGYDFMPPFVHFITEALNANEKPIFDKIKAIFQNEAETGVINNLILLGVLKSNQPELWSDIKNLLLAAQRQEGLRQAIVNHIHLAQSDAKILFLQTIFDNNLQRFASISGRVQWWFNLPLADGEETNERNIERLGRLAIQFLQDKSIDNQVVIQNKNATETHFQLWELRETNAPEYWKTCDLMIQSNDAQKRAITMYSMWNIPTKGFDFAKKYCKNETDLSVCWTIFRLFEGRPGDEKYDKNDGTWEFFERLIAQIPNDKLDNPKAQFAWENYKFDTKWLFIHWAYRVARATRRSDELLKYKARFDSDLRVGVFSDHFREHFWAADPTKPEVVFTPNDFDRNWIIENLQDKAANVTRSAFQLYAKLTPKADELPILYTLLTRKSDETRKSILDILQKQNDTDLKASIEILLSAKKEEQALAGLDLLQQLKKQNRLADFVASSAKTYSERKNAIGSKAELILHDLLDEANDVFDETNGYGLYNPKNRAVIPVVEKPTKGFFVEKMYGQPMFGLSVSLEKLEAEIRKLDAIFQENENYEYEITNYEGNKEKVLLSNPYLQRTKQFSYNTTYSESMATLPLADLFDAWFKNSGLNFLDIYLLGAYSTSYTFTNDNIIPDWLRELVKKYTQSYTTSIYNENRLGLKYPNHCSNLISYLHDTSGIEDLVLSIEMDLTQHYFASIPPEGMFEMMRLYSYMQEPSATWRDAFKAYFANFEQLQMVADDWQKTKAEKLSDEVFVRFWNIVYWYYRMLPTNHIGFNCCKEGTLGRAYAMGLIDYDEFCHLTLTTEIWNNVTNNPRLDAQNTIKNYPIYQEFLAKAKPHFLNIELKRGETQTAVSKFVVNLSDVVGVDYFSKIAKGLGKDALQRGYSYTSYLGEDKTMQFSRMLKSSTPAASDTFANFKTAIDALKLSEKRLVQFALYAPQWIVWTEKYLGWQGLQNAAWCLHAHSQNYFDLQKESEFAKYTTVSEQDFMDGAVDVAWFKAAFAEIGAERWEMVYQAAHYICENQGYIRARVYADAVLGKLPLDDCKKRVLDKRNQNYVIAIGLIPLASSPSGRIEVGLLDRYVFLQDFKKSGKKVGAQRQESEKRACTIAMENLARTAGYADPIRLTWAMETLDIQTLMQKVQTLNIDETTIQLDVNALGKAEIISIKKGKILADIPAKLKKDENIIELISIKNTLNAQHKRIKKSLEDAMIRGDIFEAKEIKNLMQHPIIKPLLSSLVLVSGDKIENIVVDFYKNIPSEKQYRIAHCSDLYASKKWADFQKNAFQTQLVQPFKQIFREFYLPTSDELAAVGISKRYEGYQIQPGQAAALLRSRGWAANYQVGLQKVLHKERIIVNVEAYADWSNASPTMPATEIQSIRFTRVGTGRDLSLHRDLSLRDVPTAIFSEIMRDLDLVVSVAHVGGVDIEASLSSMELRGIIVMETAALFGLTNIKIEKSHVFIKGQKGDYTLHLGSGIAHKVPSVMLNIKPISTQARGRIFLPFVDEDPKTAEIVSKMLLLAKDAEIQDPSILGQI
jgi:hypothetical protein